MDQLLNVLSRAAEWRGGKRLRRRWNGSCAVFQLEQSLCTLFPLKQTYVPLPETWFGKLWLCLGPAESSPFLHGAWWALLVDSRLSMAPSLGQAMSKRLHLWQLHLLPDQLENSIF